MIDEPKIINVPGIDTPLREQTLAEYCMALPPGHLALRELTELQRRSAEMFRLNREVAQLENKVFELERNLAEILVPTKPKGNLEESSGKLEGKLDEIIALPHDAPLLPNAFQPGKKTPCKLCGKEITIAKGAWHRHLQSMHPDQDRSLPQL